MSVDVGKLDFSRMMCNVMSLPSSGNPLEVFDTFKKFDEFHAPILGRNKNKVLRYIALVYDKESPLHDAYADPLRKKIIAAELAGYIKEGSKFSEVVENMIRCEDADINKMIVRYITCNQSSRFHTYTIMREVHFRESENLLNGTKTKIEDFKKISEELQLCETELLSGDAMLNVDLSRFYFEEKLELRPEDIAARLSAGKLPVEVEEDEEF